MAETSDPSKLALISRLDRVATGLEAEGYFGAAKICRAAGYSILGRMSYTQGIPRISDTLDVELSGIIDSLPAAGVGDGVVTMLKVAHIAARENRSTSWNEAPETQVCRVCGELFLGKIPEYCPTCGSHALTFRSVPAIFYLEPLEPRAVIEALAAMPATLHAAMDDLTDSQLRTPPAPDEWALRDVLWHLLMAQMLMSGRVEKMLAEEDPSLEAQATWAVEKSDLLTSREIVERYEQRRQQVLSLLRGLSHDQWLRTGRHTEFGPITIQQQMSYMAKHERYHLPQITALRRIALSP